MEAEQHPGQSLADAATLLRASDTVLLVSHMHPDADAIGSLIGLGAALSHAGKRVMMAVDGGVPERLRFLLGSEKILPKISSETSFDLVVALDSDDLGVLGECGALAFAADTPSLVIDHHAFNELYATVNYVDPELVSTTEAIVRLLDWMQWDIPRESAEGLLAGILSDTQVFRTQKAGPQTFTLVSRLIISGADYAQVLQNTFLRYESGYLKLLGEVLLRAKLLQHVYWTWVFPEDFSKHGVQQSSRFYAVDDLIGDQNARIAATFQVFQNGAIRLSMRAAPGYNVGKIADALGGGGHVLAAGCELRGLTLEEAIHQVIPLLQAEAGGNLIQ